MNSMPYAPPLPLPVPGSMPELDASVVGLDLSGMGLMSSEEENSCQQLKFTVPRPVPPRHAPPRPAPPPAAQPCSHSVRTPCARFPSLQQLLRS